MLALLYAAWQQSDEEYIVPDTGLGYWLGIAGGLIVLAVLAYPWRKKRAADPRWGKVARWFKMHMVLGIVGPTLIIIHSNFGLQSINATVAMLAMLMVVTSGVIGRFLYSRIHQGLYGAKSEVKALAAEAAALERALGEDAGWAPVLMAELKRFEAAIDNRVYSLGRAVALDLRMTVATRLANRKLTKTLKGIIDARAAKEGWSKTETRENLALELERLASFFKTVRKASGLKVYNRLFGLWHVLHFPLYILLIIAAIVHVVAVHLY